MTVQDFIFEIGVEEIPARFLPVFEKEIERYCQETLEKEMILYREFTLISTPRRIGVYIHDLADTQGTKEEELLGPPVALAWNEGSPTPALNGFLKRYNLCIDDIYTKNTPKGQYIVAQSVVGGKKTESLLSQFCHAMLLHLSNIQKMHWGDSHVLFARPLTSLIALYGEIPIDVEYGPCRTTNPQYTYGHRILCNHPIYVASASDYFSLIREKAMVLPLYSERKNSIEQGIEAIERQYKATIICDNDLLEETINLCEYPYVLLGDIDTRYLELPREVFLTTIQTHQRSFGLIDDAGRLLPYFITVTNNPRNNVKIKAGWERVLRARLEDAMFFYDIDKKSTFEQWLEELERVTFITSLGTMRERALRIQALAVYIAHLLAPHLETEASQAGLFCKADLVSAVVKEFDTLQGTMGGIYAREKGKGDIVAQAIAEHYLPIGASSSLPSSTLGSIVALADKIDMVVGCFAMQMIPTGTTDTQGIRRAVLGIIRIILEYDVRIDFNELFLYAKRLYGERDWKLKDEEMLYTLFTFFSVRIKQYFISLGFDTICIDAVLDIEDSLPALAKRIEALQEFVQTPYAKEVSMIFKRISNIVGKEQIGAVTEEDCNTNLFQHEAEYTLYATLQKVLPMLRLKIQQGQYKDALKEIQILYIPLQEFFENVLVLDKDVAIRTNRIVLLASIRCVLEQIADFKELQL